jgi:uncharacterized protein YndB with AHSA1/START domain
MSADPHPGVHPDVRWPAGWGPESCDEFVSHERRMAAPADVVFDHLIAVERWPAWQHGVSRTELVDEIAVGGRFTVLAAPHAFDGIVGELEPPRRFGWAGVSDGLSFYQSWLLLDEPGGGTRTVFHEAARGPSALRSSTGRAATTRCWVDALPPTDIPGAPVTFPVI